VVKAAVHGLERQITDKESEAIARRAGEKGVVLRNGRLAGSVHPKTGVPFRRSGFPDFSQEADRAAAKFGKPTTVRVEGVTGVHPHDFRLANQAAGFSKTPEGYTWHHVEDCKTMQLVPTPIHAPIRHTGCVALLKYGVVVP